MGERGKWASRVDCGRGSGLVDSGRAWTVGEPSGLKDSGRGSGLVDKWASVDSGRVEWTREAERRMSQPHVLLSTEPVVASRACRLRRVSYGAVVHKAASCIRQQCMRLPPCMRPHAERASYDDRPPPIRTDLPPTRTDRPQHGDSERCLQPRQRYDTPLTERCVRARERYA